MNPFSGKEAARTHDESRKVVCAFCFLKKVVQPLSEVQEEWIKSYDPAFSVKDQKCPSVLCGSCRLALSAHNKVFACFKNNMKLNFL